ncbi:iron-containing alcohol dehydrogenase, partial [Streptococcus anginosus]
RNRPQWIRLPEKIFYEKDSITYLSDENEQEISRAFIVADPGMVKFHFVDKVYEQLALRDKQVDTAIYSEVLPDPPLSQAIKIAKQMKKFAPDTIIAIGGGS